MFWQTFVVTKSDFDFAKLWSNFEGLENRQNYEIVVMKKKVCVMNWKLKMLENSWKALKAKLFFGKFLS